jgi:hypothetical protein
MGNPDRLPDDHEETFEKRRIDPRTVNPTDPSRDPRFDMHLKPAAVIPRKLSVTLLILASAIGIVILTLLGLLLYKGFMAPSPRSPERPAEERLDRPTVRPVSVTTLLPLDMDRFLHSPADPERAAGDLRS